MPAYSKQTWVDGAAGSTPLSAARLNYIETGLAAAVVPDVPTTFTAQLTASAGLAVTAGMTANSMTLTGTFTSTVNAPSATLTGALNANSAAVTGAVTANSATLTGALNANSAAVTGAVTANSATLTGALNAATATLTGTVTSSGLTLTQTDFTAEIMRLTRSDGQVVKVIGPRGKHALGSVPTLGNNGNLLSVNQASIETSAADYAGGNTNGAVARSTAQFLYGNSSLSITSLGATLTLNGVANTTDAYAPPVGTAAIPVLPGQAYTGIAHFRAATVARQVTVNIYWYDAGGTVISGRNQTDHDASAFFGDNAFGWTQAALTVTSPSNASYALLLLAIHGASNGEVHYADGMSLALGSAVTPTVNLVLNPSFEIDLSSAGANGTAKISRTTLRSYAVGTASMLVQTDSGNPNVYVSSTLGRDPSQTYTGSYYVWCATGGSFRAYLYDSGFGASVGGSLTTVPASTWTRVTVTGSLAASVYSGLALVMTGPNNSVFYIDAVQIEPGSSATAYVDGSMGAGYIWEAAEDMLNSASNDGFPPGAVAYGNQNCTSTDTSVKYEGASSIKFAPPAAATGFLGLMVSNKPVTPSTAYVFSAWTNRAAGTGNFRLQVDWYNASGTYISSSSGDVANTTTGTWQRTVLRATSPVGADHCSPLIFYSSYTGGTDIMNVDAVQMEKKDQPTAYGANGVAHGSTSRRQTPWYMPVQSSALVVSPPAGTPTTDAVATFTNYYGGQVAQITATGGLSFSPATATVAPAAGGAGALPTTPAGYMSVTVNGVPRQVPYY